MMTVLAYIVENLPKGLGVINRGITMTVAVAWQ